MVMWAGGRGGKRRPRSTPIIRTFLSSMSLFGRQLSSSDRFLLVSLCSCSDLFAYTLLGTPACSQSLFTQAGRLSADSRFLVSGCLLLKCSVFRLNAVRSLSAVWKRKQKKRYNYNIKLVTRNIRRMRRLLLY